MTLKDLIEKHGLPVKVENTYWDGWVEVVASNGTYAVGFNESDGVAHDLLSSLGYSLYTGPKKKRVLYLAVFHNVAMGWAYIDSRLFECEAHAIRSANEYHKFVKLLTDRPIEVTE